MKNITIRFDRFLSASKLLLLTAVTTGAASLITEIFFHHILTRTILSLRPIEMVYVPTVLFFSGCYLLRFGLVWYVLRYGRIGTAKLNYIIDKLGETHSCTEEQIAQTRSLMKEFEKIKNRFRRQLTIRSTQIRCLQYSFSSNSLLVHRNQHFWNLIEARLYEIVNYTNVRIRYVKLLGIYYLAFIDEQDTSKTVVS